MAIFYILLEIIWASAAVTLMYGLCRKTSRNLYTHLFKSVGRFMLGMGFIFSVYSFGLFMTDEEAWNFPSTPQNPWSKLANGPYQ